MSLETFNIRHTNAYRSLQVRKMLWVSWLCMLVLATVATLFNLKTLAANPLSLIILIALPCWILWSIELFRRKKLKTSVSAFERPDNLAELLSYHMVQHLSTKPAVTMHTMIEAAMESEWGIFVLHSINIEKSDILAALLHASPESTLEECLQWCVKAMKDLQTTHLDSTATIYAFLTNVPALAALVEKADLAVEDLKKILHAEAFHFELLEQTHHPLSPAMLVRTLGSIGRSWVIGYNNDLERLTNNISETILSYRRSVVIHRDIIDHTLKNIESRMQTNILLLGESGTGKRTLIRNIAYELRSREMRRSSPFSDVLVLKTSLLLSGGEESDQILLQAENDAKQGGRFILVIEDFAMLLSAADAKLKKILVSILEAKNIRTICIANTEDYHTLIKSDTFLDTLLEKVYVEEPSDEETMDVLLEEYFKLKKVHNVRLTYRALKSILILSRRYVGHGGLPGKAVEVLEEALLAARASSGQTVTEDTIRAILSRRTRIDIEVLTEEGKQKLLHLKERLQSHIIGQEHAIGSLSAALKRGRMNIGSGKRPIGTFLFLGTTGLGKTETAKALAKEYFGSVENMIRIDLNEFSNEASIPLLIGGPTEKGGFTEGLLIKRIQDRPSSIVLLDEIEKAHPKILNLFLQILDEGILIGGNGGKADFRNTIIIATSNAGSHWMTEHSLPSEESEQIVFRTALLETIVGERTFSPEFINRFDEIILFTQPTDDEVRQLAILMLGEIIERIMKDRGIRITVESPVIDFLAEKGFSREYGAREMRRTITQTIENYLADYLLSRSVKRGDEIAIRAEDLQH